MLKRLTLWNEFYNIFAYAVVKGFVWSLVCSVTIRPVIIGGLIARRNVILVESLLREK